jgi:hypothetical protein
VQERLNWPPGEDGAMIFWSIWSFEFSMALLESSWSIEKFDDEQTEIFSN